MSYTDRFHAHAQVLTLGKKIITGVHVQVYTTVYTLKHCSMLTSLRITVTARRDLRLDNPLHRPLTSVSPNVSFEATLL